MQLETRSSLLCVCLRKVGDRESIFQSEHSRSLICLFVTVYFELSDHPPTLSTPYPAAHNHTYSFSGLRFPKVTA